MPRKLEIESPAAMNLVMSCGDRREDICPDDVERPDFPKRLAEAEQIVAEALGRLEWTEEEMRTRAKIDASQLALAARLRREMPLPLK